MRSYSEEFIQNKYIIWISVINNDEHLDQSICLLKQCQYYESNLPILTIQQIRQISLPKFRSKYCNVRMILTVRIQFATNEDQNLNEIYKTIFS